MCTSDHSWKDCWKKSWEKKFQNIPGFIDKLTTRIITGHPKYKEKDKGKFKKTIQSAISEFKKAETESRIDYFLKDQYRKDALRLVLGMEAHELDNFIKHIEEEGLFFNTYSMKIYPYFGIELDEIDEGWLNPIFHNNDTNTSFGFFNKSEVNFKEFIRNIKENKKVFYIKSGIGKTRLLRYLSKLNSQLEETKNDKPLMKKTEQLQFHYFKTNLDLNVNKQQNNQDITHIIMVDTDEPQLRENALEFFRQLKNTYNISILIMLHDTEHFPQKMKDNNYIQRDESIVKFDMELKIDKENAVMIIC